MESSNGKFREYYLDLHCFSSLADARETVERWQTHYNELRPHRSLGHEPPAVFVQDVSRSGLLPTSALARIKAMVNLVHPITCARCRFFLCGDRTVSSLT